MGSLRGPDIGLDLTSALSTCLTLPPTSAHVRDANTLSKGLASVGPNHPRLCPPSGLEPLLGVGGEPCPHPEWSVTGRAMAWGSQGKTLECSEGGSLPRADPNPKPVGIVREIGPPDKPVCLNCQDYPLVFPLREAISHLSHPHHLPPAGIRKHLCTTSSDIGYTV